MEAPPSPRPPSPKPQASFFIPSASPRSHIISSFPQYMIYSVPSTPAAAGFSACVASCEPNPNPPTTASAKTDSDSDSDEGFTFNTGQSFRSLPPHRSMADVPADDDLFSNGQLPPLKLPPRLQASPTVSPRAPSFASRSFLGFGKKEVDPFEAAMERIRNEEELHCDKPEHWRGRSSFCQPIGTRLADWAEEREEEPLAGAKRSKESKRRSWSTLSWQLSRLLALPSTKAKGEEWVNGLPIETKSSSRRVAAEEMRSKSVSLYRRSPQGPSLLACFRVSPVPSRKHA